MPHASGLGDLDELFGLPAAASARRERSVVAEEEEDEEDDDDENVAVNATSTGDKKWVFLVFNISLI